ncbi:succinate dehydrogenase, hydrophobic membrane anchor protein [Alloalcanivorax gelatiniphagus]|uniref:Succinate dehydrogenase hydrophobic membrane anchor subunit n=1 Tax=Alloalcanivorax gelatiniphagus TaxID=1194167 RepID=A0ABY2XNF6_9GAMM|nr:succinate dehydrogenase, hydrophobic membrane anchor protein [Alloalcanivorax gelatiniphagus]TMW13304.1 succinate dehydrogenase, hydrophobic membrane anchor protein [Alloalcanivorax gelatiniphagus]|tara:strand:- start:214 stop:585 length:372 start_codon:yes stop_codon:yes gene_type:complete
MVTSVTSLGRNGLYDWLIQRVSAVVIAVYVIGMVGYLICNSDLDYATWSAFMGSVPMRIANTLMLFSVAAHTWIGLWSVTTDYLTSLTFGKAATSVRLVGQMAIALLLLVYILWGLLTIWGGA